MQTNDADDGRVAPAPGDVARVVLNSFGGGSAILADLEAEWQAERDRLTGEVDRLRADNSRLRETLGGSPDEVVPGHQPRQAWDAWTVAYGILCVAVGAALLWVACTFGAA